MNAIQLDKFNAGVRGVPLLRDIELTVAVGEVLALIGPNGAGKSSLLKAIMGDLSGNSGRVRFAGQELSNYTVAELARQRAYLPQSSELNFPFEGLDVVMLGRMPHASGRQIDSEIAMAALEKMDVSHLAYRLYTELSGGERQRIQLARVLTQVWRAADGAHRVLILDEPCASLDVAHTRMLMRCLKSMAADGVTVVMVLHDFTLAARYCQRIAAMSCGSIVAIGSPSEVITGKTMRDLFNVDATILPHPGSGYPVVCIDD
ncbi:MAG: heme ABC transporter ATP-binding protein [Pseudomonadota bacterium]